MKKLTSNQIRTIWLNYFIDNDHLELEAASLIPINDNSLLWINSGVATLKDYFSGRENPPYKNLTNSQKAIRTNDIFNVGVTARHQTFFEMLGNFSIGGYFKTKAIDLAYHLLIDEYEIEIDSLYFTVFEEDEISFNKWISLGIAETHIIKCNRKRNFWDVGTGPCGPCTEIFFDRGIKYDFDKIGEKLFIDDIENDRYVEIWNIVFSEFNNNGNNDYTLLERMNIDTGAGLERLAAISQQVPTNFDSDLFLPIIEKIDEFTSLKYDMEAYFNQSEKQVEINLAHKIIADHTRACVFAIADGGIPSNKERGYVLRRLIRRIIVMLVKLKIEENIFKSLVDVIIYLMKEPYDYLNDEKTKIIAILSKEFNIFKKTLAQGLKLFKTSICNNALNAEITFKLVDTFGFPIEIIKELSIADKIKLDLVGFDKLYENHQSISNAKISRIALEAQNGELIKLETPFEFNYHENNIKAKIVKLYDANFKSVLKLEADGYVVFDKSCFYATSGGQLHDIGYVNWTIEVVDIFKGPNLQFVHQVTNVDKLIIGEECLLSYNEEIRNLSTKNHSVEHLIHASLAKLIDSNIKQEGAFKSAKKVTFDFQYHLKLSEEQLKAIENEINKIIKEKIEVKVLDLSLAEAEKLGAKAYFAEVYKKIKGTLRVIKMGDKSIELCGGTHVKNTNDIEKFKIIDYYPKGSGSWRIEAITTRKTINDYLIEEKELIIKELEEIRYEVNTLDIKSLAINTLLDFENKDMNLELLKEKLIAVKDLFIELRNKKLREINQKEINQIKEIANLNNDKINIQIFDNLDNKNIFHAINDLINEKPSEIFVFFNKCDGKTQYMLGINELFAKENKINLNINIKFLNNLLAGKGGGKPNLVQGGSPINNLKLFQTKINEFRKTFNV